LTDRIALVTGGSRGIGRATCVALARRGFLVAVNYRTGIDAAKETLSLIEESGGEGIVIEADVTDRAAIESMFEQVEDALGPVGVLVNNAGVRKDTLGVRMSDDMWDEVLATNLTGAFTCSRRALRTMIRERWGRMVNVSSVAGVHGSVGQGNYSAAKAGLVGLTRTLAREVARKNITVNAVAPGLVDTDLTSTLSETRRQELIAEIPMGRAGTSEEIAQLIAFLCSDDASYVTGTVVVADGGMTA
jgi:3-oxoacyl-[acyl-carrier protein] reductase